MPRTEHPKISQEEEEENDRLGVGKGHLLSQWYFIIWRWILFNHFFVVSSVDDESKKLLNNNNVQKLSTSY